MAVKIDGAAALKLRTKLGENQTDFWRRLGCTQSAGSRYESGRTMPAPLRKLYFLLLIAAVAPAMSGPNQRAFRSLS